MRRGARLEASNLTNTNAPAGGEPKLWTANFITLMLSTFALFASFYFMMPVLPVFVADRLGGDQSVIGLVSGVFTITAVTFRPLGGYLMDRYGRRGVHLAALVAFAAVVACYTLVGNLAALLAVRMLHGFPWGAANTAANTVASDMVPPARRGEGLGMFGMAQTLAMAVAPALAIAIVGDGRFVLLFASATGLAVLALLLGVRVQHPKVSNPAARLNLASLIEGRVGWLSASLAFVTAGYAGVTTFIVVYAKELGITQSGLFFTLLAVGLVISRLTAGRQFDLRGPRPVIGTGMVLLALCHTLLWWGRAGFFPAAVVLGLGFGVVVPSYQAMAVNIVPGARRGAAYATLLGSFDIGVGIGAYVLGVIARSIGYAGMYGVISVMMSIPAWLFFAKIAPRYAAAVETAAAKGGN